MNWLDEYSDWKQYTVNESSISAEWSNEDLKFDWIKTVQTDEVPENDAWDIFTTDQKLKLQNIQKSWGVDDSTTEHWMCFSPELQGSLQEILKPFENYTHSYNLLKLDAGKMLVWHYDTYATFVKTHDLSENKANNIHRSIVMLSDWDCGQVLQVGNDILSHWHKGKMYTWQSYTWHGLCNFGPSEIILAQISYLKE